METIVQWATILSPIIAVVIAWWTVRSSSNDTNRKIAALEESTRKQVDSIKQLTKLQADIALLQLDMELWEIHFRLHKLSSQTGNALEDNRSIRDYINEVNLEDMNEEERAKYREIKYFDDQLRSLEGHIKRLDQIKQQINNE